MSFPIDRPAPPRLLPAASLPRSTYVPGRTAKLAPAEYRQFADAAAPVSWQQSNEYLWGCELFNHGFYWEAHEVWEELWHRLGRTGPDADFLKGLIKLAAVGVKVREGKPLGVERHCRRAAELFTSLLPRLPAGETAHRGGLSLAELVAAADPARWDSICCDRVAGNRDLASPMPPDGRLIDLVLFPRVQPSVN